MTKYTKYFCGLAAGAALFLGAPATQAQTGPDLLLKVWPKEEKIQSFSDLTLANSGSTKNSDDFQLTFYETSGRARMDTASRADPRFGWNYLDINTSGDPALPSHLIDTSLAFGMGIADMDGWLVGATVGVGYAGAGEFNDGNAWYGMADILVGKNFSTYKSFGFVLDYNGNRTIMPDVPIPGFLYTDRYNPEILYGIGLPYSSLEWKPNEKFTLTAKYYMLTDIEVRADYDLIKNFGVFAELMEFQEAFHANGLKNGIDRIIYDSRRAEIGVRWSPAPAVSLIVAGGYMFSQEFNVGFDVRDQDRIAKPSDEAYGRFALEVRY